MKRSKKSMKRWIISVAIIFDNSGKILLSQRHDPKNKQTHKKWEFPGGGIEYDEHPHDTVHREVKEETGIIIKLLKKEPMIMIRESREFNSFGIILAFPARYVSGKLDTSHDKETSDASWYNEDEIDFSVCLPGMKEMITFAKQYAK